ncbi:endonuclease/exonuclease/phosphatase family protein [Polaromonas sp. P1(28)-8]|nr:endonuclease/exonuclease/phosphatase family protein [Polaromonas sp. P1(28)-8]
MLTVNIHKGFTFFNRKFILPELREAVRTVGADVVFLQEVTGNHIKHADKFDNYPDTPHYEFLADTIWPQFAYGRNAVYTNGHHGNAVLSKFPIVRFENRDVSISGPERRGLLHCRTEGPRPQRECACRLRAPRVDGDAPRPANGNAVRPRAQGHSAPRARGRGWRLQRLAAARTPCWRVAPTCMRCLFRPTARPQEPSPRLPLLRLDRIYVRNAIGHAPVVLPSRPWSHLSDHAPLAAEIEL